MSKTKRRRKRTRATTKNKTPKKTRATPVEDVDYTTLLDPADRPLPFHLDADDSTATEDISTSAAPEEDAGAENDEPTSDDLMLNAARKAAAQGEGRRAVSIYRELLTSDPGRTDVRFSLALTLKQVGALDDALEEMDRCVHTHPDNPAYVTARGALLTDRGSFAAALKDLQAALDLNPASVDTHFHFGVLMARRGLWADALPFLRRSIELDPGCAAAYLHLGDALNHVDDLTGALQAYQRCSELGPTNAKAFYGLGVVYDRLNQPEDAAAMYRRSREMALL